MDSDTKNNEDKREKMREYMKEYNKKYKAMNRDKTVEYAKKYYAENKDRIKEQVKRASHKYCSVCKVDCKHYSRHIKTQKHLKNLDETHLKSFDKTIFNEPEFD